MRLGFCSIALAILIQQDLDYILLKTDIHSFVLNTETFLKSKTNSGVKAQSLSHILLKTDIHSFVLNTETFLCNI